MEELRYLPYEEAKKLVSDIVEMEHPTDDGRRIFNVYNQRGESVCWFDADEVEEEIDAEEFEEVKEHILHFIPEWAD
jgi:DNA-directed RNA polymerase subunit F